MRAIAVSTMLAAVGALSLRAQGDESVAGEARASAIVSATSESIIGSGRLKVAFRL